MTSKKDIMVAVLATFCLTSTLFMVLPIRSQEEQQKYDPWYDVDDDGIIDIFDVVKLTTRYETTGTAINKTELLLGVNATYASLLSRIDSLNATVSSLMTAVNNTLVLIWDSGWYGPTIGGDTVFLFHATLDIADAVVYMVGKKTLTDDTHQIDYGGYVNVASYYGAYWWKLEPTSITFHRHGNDANWVYVRITIWQRVVL
jgi:hypothetical protein